MANKELAWGPGFRKDSLCCLSDVELERRATKTEPRLFAGPAFTQQSGCSTVHDSMWHNARNAPVRFSGSVILNN